MTNKQTILQHLAKKPPQTLTQISKATGIEPGILGTLIGKMCRDGLLRQVKARRIPFKYEVRKCNT
jgi:DNA-binding MarR family transcriptional regulator